ncbi:ribosome biogenesis protein ytm1 [Coemansia sp. Benny D115]|nr:ribosome biogenesis protein ytm1 [Coemansia sp. Benny D115]
MPRAARRYNQRAGTGEDDMATFAALSAPQQLSTLEALVDDARAASYEAISSYNGDILGTRIYGADPLDAVATANDKYEAAREQQGSTPRLDAIGRALRAVVRLAKAHANLREMDEQLQHGDLAVAASSVAEAATLLAELTADPECFKLVARGPLDTLQSLLLKKRAALRAELEYVADSICCVRAQGPVAEVSVAYMVSVNADGAPYENSVSSSDLFFAMAELGLATARADAIADTLVTHCFVPLLRRPEEPLAVARTRLGATLSVGSFTSKSTPGVTDSDRCALVRDKWASVLDFMRQDVFHEVDIEDDHADLYAYIGSRLWSTLCPLVRDVLLMPMIPSDPVLLGDTQALVPLLELEDKWLEMGLVQPEALRIKMAVQDVVQAYMDKRRRDLLAVVAGVLASDDTNTVVVGGDSGGILEGGKMAKKDKSNGKSAKGAASDSVLGFPRCSISQRAQTLVDFARETVSLATQETTKDTTDTAALYFYAVRDAFVLYRCLLPRYGNPEDAKAAFVMYNDCEYICHHLATLGLKGREKWPDALKASATFVDTIASYRALAKTALGPMLNRVRGQVAHALGPWTKPECSLLSTLRVDGLDGMDTALALACGILERISSVALAYLPSDMCFRTLGLLIGPVVQHVAERIKSAAAPSDSEARALLRLVAPALGLADSFKYLSTESRNGLWFAKGSRAPVSKYCAEWDSLLEQIERLRSLSANIPTSSVSDQR